MICTIVLSKIEKYLSFLQRNNIIFLQIYCLAGEAKCVQISYINPTQPILVCHIPSDILMGRNCKARPSKARPYRPQLYFH